MRIEPSSGSHVQKGHETCMEPHMRVLLSNATNIWVQQDPQNLLADESQKDFIKLTGLQVRLCAQSADCNRSSSTLIDSLSNIITVQNRHE